MIRRAWKRHRWAREQRRAEYSAFISGSWNHWNRLRQVNNITGVWAKRRWI